MSISWILNPFGLILLAIIFFVAFYLTKKMENKKERLQHVGTFVQSGALFLAFLFPMFYLQEISNTDSFGHNLMLSIYLVLIGSFINIVCRIVSLVKYK